MKKSKILNRKVKQLFENIKRVIDFLPIVWRHRDYDYRYSIEIFKYSLQRQADFFENGNTFSAYPKQTASRIRTAVNLMQKVYDEEYATEYFDLIESLYGKTSYEFASIEGTEYFSLKVTNERAFDEEHQKQIDNVRTMMLLHCRDRQERAHKLLWRYLEHNIRNWWD